MANPVAAKQWVMAHWDFYYLPRHLLGLSAVNCAISLMYYTYFCVMCWYFQRRRAGWTTAVDPGG